MDTDTGWKELGEDETRTVTEAFRAGAPSVEYVGYKGRKFEVTLNSPEGFFQIRKGLHPDATPTIRRVKATDSATGLSVRSPRSLDLVWQVELDTTTGKEWSSYSHKNSKILTKAYLCREPKVTLE